MNTDIKSGIGFLEELSAFASRIATFDQALYSVDFNSLCFGSFSVVMGNRKHRFKATWDGREFFLDVFKAVFSDSRSLPDWKHIRNRRIEPAPYKVIFAAIIDDIKGNLSNQPSQPIAGKPGSG
jgi:hypothetical protein